MSGEFSIEVRQATRADIARTEDPGAASTGDGAAAFLIDGELVAVTNEYGTALLVAGSNHTPDKEAVEEFNEAAMKFYEKGMT